jgi:hypothetical protein
LFFLLKKIIDALIEREGSVKMQKLKSKPLRIMLDTNVWEPIVTGVKNDDHRKQALNWVKEKIKDGTVVPIISAAYLIEQIEKKNRKMMLSQYGKVIVKSSSHDNRIHIDISPTRSAYSLPEIAKQKLSLAAALGFKFINTHRIGMPHFDTEIIQPSEEELSKIMMRYDEIYKLVTFLKCGDFHIKKMCDKIYMSNPNLSLANFLEIIGLATSNEEKEISTKYIAELCDGDQVLTCYAYDLDYLCTFDQARGSLGNRSIFANINRVILRDRLGINICSPKEIMIDVHANEER